MFYKPSFNKQLYEAEPELLKTGGSSFADTVEASPGERVCVNFYSSIKNGTSNHTVRHVSVLKRSGATVGF